MNSKISLRVVLATVMLFVASVPARADVILSFSFSVVNIGENPELFTFEFLTPFAGGPFDTLTSEFAATVTDLDASGSVNVNPDDPAGMMVPSVDGTPIPAAALGDGCNPIDAGGFTTACDPFSTFTLAVATLASGSLSARVAFVLSGGDSLAGSGRVILSNAATVPEPASLLLLGLGAAVAARRRRSRRA